MKDLIIENVRVVNPGEGVVASSLLIRDGRIADVNPSLTACAGADRVDGCGRLLTPGLIDVHTHGICGERYDDPAAILPASRMLPRFGTTTVVTTLSGARSSDFLDRLHQVAGAARKSDGARMDMLHLEGPFLALPGAGGPGVAGPGDVTLLQEMQAAANGQIKCMSVSPEQDNIVPVIEALRAQNACPFITHTKAGVEDTQRAIDAGARHATHFYDVFHVPGDMNAGVRPVGAVEVILADPRCSVDFICDGVHVAPAAVECALASKGYGGVALITDANSAAGRPPGIYAERFRKRKLRVFDDGGCRVYAPGTPEDGILAGSALTMDAGIRNLRRWLRLPDEQIWAMGTSVPAAVLGLDKRGVIETGADADLVLWDDTSDNLRALHTWVAGRTVFCEADDHTVTDAAMAV